MILRANSVDDIIASVFISFWSILKSKIILYHFSILFHMRRIFITGGAGFIGTAITERLIDENQVVIYDSLRRNALARTKLRDHPNLQLIKGDILDFDNLNRSINGSEIVLHLAAVAGVDTVLDIPVETMRVNLLGTYNVVEAARREKNIKRFINFSTSEVFGAYAYRVREGDTTSLGPVGEARWTYAVSKLATEHLTYTYYKQYGLPALAIRPFNVYGPRQIGEGAIHHFVVRALQGQDLEIHNDGGQIRAWCYIDDLVDGVLMCLKEEQAIGETFNLGNPRSVVTVHHLAQQVRRLSGSLSKLVFVKKDQRDVELRVPNIDKARSLLGFEPKIDLEEGLLRTIEWYREQIDNQ